MFMSRISLSPDANVRDVAAVANGGAYADHRLMWGFFGQERSDRDFVFRRMERRNRPSFLVVSQRQPMSDLSPWTVESKPYDPQLRAGDELVFSLRANPVVRRREDDGRQRRHDVVMDAKQSLNESRPDDRVPMHALIAEASGSWLLARADRLGFELDGSSLSCDGYRQRRVRRRGRTISFSTVDIDGLLRVADPERFRRTLFRGIGPSKAFGCGLLLVRRF